MFTCSANGGPGNMFSWIRTFDNVTVGNTSNLTISVSGAADGGQYMCEVSNLAGKDSANVTLNGNNIHICGRYILFIQLVLSLSLIPHL